MVSAADDEALACLAGLVLFLLGKVTSGTAGELFSPGATADGVRLAPVP